MDNKPSDLVDDVLFKMSKKASTATTPSSVAASKQVAQDIAEAMQPDPIPSQASEEEYDEVEFAAQSQGKSNGKSNGAADNKAGSNTSREEEDDESYDGFDVITAADAKPEAAPAKTAVAGTVRAGKLPVNELMKKFAPAGSEPQDLVIKEKVRCLAVASVR